MVSLRSGDLFDSPAGMFTDERVRVLYGLLQGRKSSRPPGIPQGNGHIAQVASPPGAPDGTCFELAFELSLGKTQLLWQLRLGRARSRPKCQIAVLSCESIPGAHLLANVTTKDPLADLCPQFGRDRVA